MQVLVEKIDTTKSREEIFKVFKNDPYPVILDSSLNDNRLGRYSVVLSNPYLVFKSKNNIVEIIENGVSNIFHGNPLGHLRELLHKYRTDAKSHLPCANGCCAGFFSYDLCRIIEKVPSLAKEEYDIPDIMQGFYNFAVIMDHQEGEVYVSAASVGRAPGKDDVDVLKSVVEYVKNKVINTKQPTKETAPADKLHSDRSLKSDFTKETYCKIVEKAREYIRNGDIFQVNLSQRFRVKVNEKPFEIYNRLRNISPAPFSSYLDFGEVAVLSNSPERFIRIRDGIIETRPIKGTRPRGKSYEEDIKLREELLNSEKDRAELTMIVDLERNDLGRVCKIGSVNVERLFELEEYATVFHLVSTVAGKLKDDADIVDCIKATFPGGSITGAPKIRAMEIIDELEPCRRNIYTGAIGYIGFDNTADLNIAIRTIVVKNGEAFYNVGGGIVWDSVPEKEYQETLDKGMAMMKVLNS